MFIVTLLIRIKVKYYLNNRRGNQNLCIINKLTTTSSLSLLKSIEIAKIYI